MEVSAPFIGIDFGTSKSTMAWYDPRSRQAEIIKNAEGEEKTPSVVYYGESQILVGKAAEYMIEDKQERGRVIISVKRELVPDVMIALPGKQVRAVEVAAEILRKLKYDAQTFHFYQEVQSAVIACPAAFDTLQREKIEEAGRLAGFSEVVLLDEPTAAALAYAKAGLQVGNHVLVYDLGAGTFDLAVVTRDNNGSFRLAIEPKGMSRCGGDDFDLALYNYCDEIAQKSLGRPISLTGELDLFFLRECRERKENLSTHETGMFSSLLASQSGITRFKYTLNRATFEQLIHSHVESTVRMTQAIIEEANAWGYAVDTVVLIGGSSRVPLAIQLLKQTLPLQPRNWHQQDMAVALGAAYYAYSLWGAPPAALSDTASTSGGAEVYRRSVMIAYADHRLTQAQVEQLGALARELQLRPELAAAVERDVMGDVKERILERLTRPSTLPNSPPKPAILPPSQAKPTTLPGSSARPTTLPGSQPMPKPTTLPGESRVAKPERLPGE